LQLEVLRLQAEGAADKIGLFISDIQSQLGWTIQQPLSATIEQRQFDALRLLRQVPAITEVSQLDATGREQLRISRITTAVVDSGKDLSQDPAFVGAMANKVYYSPLFLRRQSEPYMTLALAGARDAGVSIALIGVKFIWDLVARIGQAYVIDAQGRLIAHSDVSLVFRNTDMTRLPQVQAARTAVEPVHEAKDIHGRGVLTAYAPVTSVAPHLGWLVLVELPIEQANALGDA
jgi:hypothetical protein